MQVLSFSYWLVPLRDRSAADERERKENGRERRRTKEDEREGRVAESFCVSERG